MDRIGHTAREVSSAMIPVVIMVIILRYTVLPMPNEILVRFLVGSLMVFAGLVLFLQGTKIGLFPIGEMIGAELPQKGSVWIVIIFAFILGFVITIAEPDVQVLTGMVDDVSGGAISKYIVLVMIALGVAIFVALAMLRVFLKVPIQYLLIGGYLLSFLLALFVPAEYFALSFDASGVTTGPMTVPFILALGIGLTTVLGSRSSSNDAFGFIALASIGPIISMMILGVILS
ncbi:MAG: DUF1538 domain-containing protein [Candidatus Woesearchaeota archaeon]